MANSRLFITLLTVKDYPEAVEVYRNSLHYLVELSSEAPESAGLEMLTREASDARVYSGIVVCIRLRGNQQMVGVASYVPSGYNGQPSHAWIALLMIAEKFHYQGYGTEAYQLIEETISSNTKVLSIGLGVLANNPVALRFWQKMGYRTTGIRKPDAQGHEIILMEKVI
jgi:RimJ/RimL family protein N-acetyltransferase